MGVPSMDFLNLFNELFESLNAHTYVIHPTFNSHQCENVRISMHLIKIYHVVKGL